MTDHILTDWTEEKASNFNKMPQLFSHNLHQNEMFSDAGLADLLDRYPREKLDIYTMGGEGSNKDSFVHGEAKGLTGAQIMQAVHEGRLWLNMRNANDYLPDYGALTDALFAEVNARTPGLKTLKHDTSILISSPNAKVYYHFDIPYVMLWQIRGEKTAWIYPKGAPYMSDEEMEAVALQETEEEISYDPAFDEAAFKAELKPGLMANWPQMAPHRIDNGNCVNVSLSCEFMTMPGLIRANALFTNGVLRRKHGMNPVLENDGALKLYTKAAMARLFKAFNSRKAFAKTSEPVFAVDLSAENAVRMYAAA